MASAEMTSAGLPSTYSRNQSTESPVNLTGFAEKARDELLFKDFETCINTCETGISKAKFLIHDKSSKEDLETLCILAVQAYAELNRWLNVLPFIQKVYGSVEDCPEGVILLCVMLHARVKEYSQCHAITSVWLRHNENFSKPRYSEIVDTYIAHVLLARGQVGLIQGYLESCPGLTSTDRQMLLDGYRNDIEKVPQNETALLRVKSESFQSKDKKMTSHPDQTKESKLLSMVKTIGKTCNMYNLRAVVKVAVCAMCAFLLLTRGSNGDMTLGNSSRLSMLFNGFIRIMKSYIIPKSKPV